jgi:hypothetical protein
VLETTGELGPPPSSLALEIAEKVSHYACTHIYTAPESHKDTEPETAKEEIKPSKVY